jgi:hypothetical protein
MKAGSCIHHQFKNDKVEPKMSKGEKITKIFGFDFLTC